MNTERSGAAILIECLKRQGVEFVFGYPGGAVLPIYDELFADDGIRVNAVAPGRTKTRLWLDRAATMAADRGCTPEQILEEFSQEIPIGRFAEPEEIASVAAFVVSERASYMTGQNISVDGGIGRGLL